jgi:ribonuclease HI
MPYYAVHKGKFGPYIYDNWPECYNSIDGFVGAIYKKFETMGEATTFMENGFGNNKPRFIQKREDYETNNQDEIYKVLNAEDSYKNLIIYTDGSCIREDKVYCGYGIVIPELNIKLAEQLIDNKLTNNRAEMRAILHAIELVSDEMKSRRRLCIFTDSQYCKYIFQGTGERYEKSGFMKSGEEVPNKDMIIKALEYMRKYDIVILKVRAHTNSTDIHSTYNDFADKLANEGAMKMKMKKDYKPNSIIENMKIYHDSIIHPFEKNDIKKSSTPQVEIINKNKNNNNKQSEIINNSSNSISNSISNSNFETDCSYRYNDKSDWREKEREQFKNKIKMNQLFNMNDDEDDDDDNELLNKSKSSSSSSSNVREVSVKIINNKVNKFTKMTLNDFLDK